MVFVPIQFEGRLKKKKSLNQSGRAIPLLWHFLRKCDALRTNPENVPFSFSLFCNSDVTDQGLDYTSLHSPHPHHFTLVKEEKEEEGEGGDKSPWASALSLRASNEIRQMLELKTPLLTS